MSLTIKKQKRSRSGHAKPLSIIFIELSANGMKVRVGQMMTYFGVSHSTLYDHVRAGLIPSPDGYDNRRPFWYTETIRSAIEDSKARHRKGKGNALPLIAETLGEKEQAGDRDA